MYLCFVFTSLLLAVTIIYIRAAYIYANVYRHNHKKGNSIKTTTKTEIRFRKTDTLAVKRTKVLRAPIADGFREIIYQPNIFFFGRN